MTGFYMKQNTGLKWINFLHGNITLYLQCIYTELVRFYQPLKKLKTKYFLFFLFFCLVVCFFFFFFFFEEE